MDISNWFYCKNKKHSFFMSRFDPPIQLVGMYRVKRKGQHQRDAQPYAATTRTSRLHLGARQS
jgi:hypothetical protein